MQPMKTLWQLMPFHNGSRYLCGDISRMETDSSISQPLATPDGQTNLVAQTVSWTLKKFKPIAIGSALLLGVSATAQAAIFDSQQLWSGNGGEHSCAVTTLDEAKCWGSNDQGQLGNDSTTDNRSPGDVTGGFTVKSLALGQNHSCAVVLPGRGVKCWGYNNSGQLGHGLTNKKSLTAVNVVGLNYGVKAIDASKANSCAITDSGYMRCWGFNSHGQLGSGTRNNSLIPVNVLDSSGLPLANITAVAMGQLHTCALIDPEDDDNGGVKCWGANGNRQLGQSIGASISLTPVDVIDLSTDVKAIAAGHKHSCALKTDGTVKCWGNNQQGQLGHGGTEQFVTTPVEVAGLTGAIGIAVGINHSCALTASEVLCWGQNTKGQLGDGTTTNSHVPVSVSGLSSDTLVKIAAGSAHSCVLTGNDGIKCWGHNFSGQLGNASNSDSLTPVIAMDTSVNAVPGPIAAILNISIIKSGTVSVTSGATTYTENCGANCYNLGVGPQTVTLNATPDSGYDFLRWRYDCSGTNPNNYELTISDSLSCNATFKVAPEKTLQVNIDGNGSVAATPSGSSCGTNCYDFGTTTTTTQLTATPDSGYEFSNWASDCNVTDTSANPISVDVNSSAMTCTAHFAAIVPDNILQISISGSGSVAVNTGYTSTSCGSDCYNYGATTAGVNLVATANAGYQFASWGGSCSGQVGENIDISVNGTVNCSANFTAIPDNILQVSTSGSGTVNVTATNSSTSCGANCYNYGQASTTATLTASPNSGYSFSSWGGACSGSNSMVSKAVVGNTNCTAHFAALPPPVRSKLQITIVGQGTVSVSPAASSCGHNCYNYGGWAPTVSLTATPTGGYTFSSWSWACSGTNANDGTAQVVYNNTVTCVVNFEEPYPGSDLNNAAAYYILEPSSSVGKTFVRVTNLANQLVPVKGTLFNANGDIIGDANSVLNESLMPRATFTLSNDSIDGDVKLHEIFGSWTGHAWLEITEPKQNIAVMNTFRNPNLSFTNFSEVNNKTAFVIPPTTSAEQAELFFINRHEHPVTLSGTLYGKDGMIAGPANKQLFTIPPKGIKRVTGTQLAGPGYFNATWLGRARLELTNPSSGIRVINALHTTTGDISNLSHANTDAIFSVPHSTSPDRAIVRITNTSNGTVDVRGILYQMDGQMIQYNNNPERVFATIAPQATAVLYATDLENIYDLSAPWDKRIRMVITSPTNNLRVLSTMRDMRGGLNGTLASNTVVSDYAAYNIPNVFSADDVYVRITNVTNVSTPVRGTLYDHNGHPIGAENTLLTNPLTGANQLAGNATMVLDQHAFQSQFGNITWSKRARLVITYPQTGIKVLNLIRPGSGVLSNMTAVQER